MAEIPSSRSHIKKHIKLIQILMEHIKRDILNCKTENQLKLFTETNPLKSKKYEKELNKFVDSVENVLKQNMR